MSELNITKTMWEFMDDQAFVRVIGGPIGSGKSICCIHELVKSAIQQKPNANGERKSRTLIVRNTLDQLKSTVLKSWADWIKNGEWGIYKASDKTFYMDHNLPDGTRLKAEFMFMPLDTPDDVRKALSLELTFLWANEWREIHPEVVDGLLMRLRRYPSMKDGGPSRSCAIFDTNMPDLDTWHFDKMENPPANWSIHLQPPAILNLEEYLSQEGEEPDANEGTPDAQGTSWWLNPRADNLHNLDARYYPDIIPGKSEDFINVYLRCRYGRSLSGVPVFDKTFNPEFHIADKPFAPLKSPDHPLIVGLDFGRCYDDQTEVLTKAGWKLFKDVDETTDLAATMSPVTREFEYTPINFKVAIPHVGDMLLWSGTNIDLCVTPEHRFPYTNRETPDIVRWASAEELSHKLTSHKYALVAPRRWEGVEPTNLPYNMDPILYAEFLGWWMADGHVEKGTNRVTVVQKKPAPDLEMVMNAVAAAAGASLRTKAGFAFSDAILAEHLRTFGPKHGGGRRVPDSIRFASPAVIWAFLMAYTRGDGHIRAPRRGTAHEEHTIWFASRELAGQFQDLAQKVGWGSALRWQPGGTSTFADGRDVTCQGGWVVCFKKKWERVELLPDQFSRIQYDGTVYCLNVPHHILCVRRNGKVSWNGNTPATALLQRNAWGQLVVLDELTSENMGIETFLDRKLAPLLAKEQYLGCHVVIAPDPAGWAKQQIGEVSPVDIIKQRGFKVAKPVTNDPKRRIEAVERVLLKHVDGKPAFVVNPHCKELIKGFRYGYRYRVNRTGVQDDKPEKNASSHCMDGCQYGVLVAETGADGALNQRNAYREVMLAPVSSRAWT